MFTTIIIALLMFISVVLFILRPTVYEGADGERSIPVWTVGFLTLAIGLFWLALATTTTVEAKQVGVLTTFGKPAERTLQPGLSFKAPWQKVTEIDATIQTDEYHGEDCITVVLADKNTACISATNRWSVNRENADEVYADFRSDDPTKSLRDAVVSTQFKAAVNAVFNSYDATAENTETPDSLAERITEIVSTKTGGLVEIESITISYIKPGEKVQAKIDALQSQVAQTRIAQEKRKTASEEAQANKILSESISNDPNVLVSKCLDLISEGAFAPPAGFSCWPGGGTGVVIPQANALTDE